MNRIALTPLSKPVSATVEIPGSKSYTNRALFLAAMTKEPVMILNPLVSDDTEAMLSCLGELGIQCARTDDGIRVGNDIAVAREGTYDIDANLSGTTIRFILALSCVVPGVKTIHGKEGLNKRPIGDLVDALLQLGARIEYLEKEGFPPVRVSSSKLTPGTVRINGAVSSQFLSALLMVSPLVGEVIIEVEGELVSKPYADMTIDTMKQFGVSVENDNHRRFTVSGGQAYRATEYSVEGDVSSASYFAAIAALTKSRITLTNMNPRSAQADMGFFKILEKMENEIMLGDRAITVQGKGIKALDVSMEDCPDQAQTLAVLAAFAAGKTTISGVRSLRVKETERVKAVESELAKMGIQTESTEDTLTIHGGNPKAAAINTYGDHRMAFAFAVAGAALQGMVINDADVVSKTFPSFWEKLASVGVGVMKV